MKQHYTFIYTRKSVCTVTVTARDQETAQEDVEEILERAIEALGEEGVEVEFLDLKDVEPEGDDRDDDF